MSADMVAGRVQRKETRSDSPCDSAAHLNEDVSDSEPLSAQTVDTVMAAQVSHNVVGNQESTGGSPLVDAHANDSTISTAGNGSNNITNSSTEHAASILNDAKTYHNVPSETDPSSLPSGDQSVSFVTQATEEMGMPNGLHGSAIQEGPLDGRLTPDISGNVSVSSDTDNSRADAGEQGKEGIENRHTRANSVKKPTTFSKVSVSKQFLAKTATGTASPIAVQPSSKASTLNAAPPPTTRPRLIAKTGPSLISKPRTGSEAAAGPDASKVWNKNRPPQPTPSKQFTDEELKQQYGIHMASRMQSDDNSKEPKWADIDDDEEDWVPETVQWMDGTKSTLTPAEQPPVQKEIKLLQPPQTKPEDQATPSAIQVKRPSETGPPKTILKPGSMSQAKQNGATAASPGPESKATLKAKSPAPAPARSPWAPVPAVDKVSVINPPVQQPERPIMATQDVRNLDQGSTMPPPPTREMAPDTFDRSWREGEGGRRELFNSANGNYEPVPEGRRASRANTYGRQPSLLQRPSQSGMSPAEPSAAFQTRSQGEGAPWEARRRGSSISQGSMPPRRLSVSQSAELPSPQTERRQSTVIGHDMRGPPQPQANEDGRSPKLPQQSTLDSQLPPPPPTEQQPPQEDAVEVQARVMKAAREEARKRRQDEEAREEAAKQERLKAKLAALEGAGKSKKERDAESAKTPTTEKSAETVVPSLSAVEEQNEGSRAAESSAQAAPSLEAQAPMPSPTPQATTEVSQLSQDNLDIPSPIPPKVQDALSPSEPLPSNESKDRHPPRAHLSPRAGAHGPFNQQSSPHRPPVSSYSSPGDRHKQPFARTPFSKNDTTTSWPISGSNGNVWGSSGIGNGTFASSSAFAPLQAGSLPPPPGMTQQSTSARISPQGFGQEARSPTVQQSQLAEQPQTLPPPGIGPRSDMWPGQSRVSGASPSAPGMGRQTHPPGPIAPPSRAQQQQQQAQPQPLRQDPLSAWNQAAQRLPGQYKAAAADAERNVQDASGPGKQHDEVIRETFKQTKSNGVLGSRRFERAEYTIHDGQGSRAVSTLSPAPPATQTQPSGPFPATSPLNEHWKQSRENTVRIPDGSLNPAHGGMQATQPGPIAPPNTRTPMNAAQTGNVNFRAGPLPTITPMKDDSPPPPEATSHPVMGDNDRPKVRLPHSKPVVKLPPPPSVGQHLQQTNNVMPPRPAPNFGPPGARPIAMDPAWQARFNGLFNRTPISTETPPSPPKTPPKMQGSALAVASSSRPYLDEVPASPVAAVSLPQVKRNKTAEGFVLDGASEVVSKPYMEHMFSEELSFGSLPKIRVPRNVTYNNAVYSRHGEYDMISMPYKHQPRQANLQIMPELPWKVLIPKNPRGIFVKMFQTKFENRNKLVFFDSGSPTRKVSERQDRKPSGKFTGKGKGQTASDKDSTPSTPVATTPTTGKADGGPKKTNFQRGTTPATTASNSKGGSPSNASGVKKESKWAKPPRGAKPAQKVRV